MTGQDGSYLAELLLEKGYEVHGMARRASAFNTRRIDHVFDKLHVHHGDMTDGQCLAHLLAEVRPDEVYNLAAQSHVAVSFENPVYTAQVNAIGTVTLLEAVRSGLPKNAWPRIYQASSSEMFGNEPAPQDENTPLRPRSPYACAKVHAHLACVNYREAYGVLVSCGVMFNHESPRRGETFVTRKVTRAVARIKLGLQDEVSLGNVEALRDWGWAPDYVRAMWLMLQHNRAEDFVVATGESHTVQEFVEKAFGHVGLCWTDHVRRNVPRYTRPAEVHELRGDASKARRVLGWEPSVGFDEIVRAMVDADVKMAERDACTCATDVGGGCTDDWRHCPVDTDVD